MATRGFSLTITTDGSGNATAYSPYTSGRIKSITYVKNNYAAGVDFTITIDGTGETVWAQNDVNASVTVYPRSNTHSTACVANLYAASGTNVTDVISFSRDRLKFVLAQGGNATSGTFKFVIEDV